MFRDQQPAFAAHRSSGNAADAKPFVHLSAAFAEGRLATSGFSATPSAPAATVAGISPGHDSAQRVEPIALAGADGGDQAEHRVGADRGGLPALAAALVFHGLIAAALLWHYSTDTTIKVEPPASKMVHATVVEDPAIAQAREQQRQQAEEARRQEQKQAREQAAEQAREQQRAAEAQRQQQQRAEQQRQANAERAREQAAQQQAQQRSAEAAQQRAAEQAKAQADAKAAAQAKAKAQADAKAAAAQRAAESNTPETLSQTPAPTNRVAPVYPRLAQARNMQGSVTVRFTIRKDGSVDASSISVVNSTNSMFEKAATDAVRKWQFKSRARPGIVEQPVKFELN
ncbi:energy transducer TonB [Carnimonas bestiolae]|uniref:energy transducer TonB n=1 Tax=Carnimonas bestiolae TaxID=3402172 RepID=UPI003EDC73B1